ncbi:MAG TPA: tol-pal system protein YbgF [Terriglobales bacterium]|nr:tol-pal system protein YbgF [Terriglobales bacterium]
MKFRVSSLLVLFLALAAVPSFGANKEMVQLQTQVQALQDQMAQMRQSFDERMGIMRNLIEQSTDNVNKVAASVDQLNQSIQKSRQDDGARADQLSGQVQALHDTVDELKARMTKVTQQLDAIQSAQQNIVAPSAPAAGAPQAGSQAPPADVLYNNALRDYNAGNYDLASQEFADYLKFYPNTELAGNAQFYLGDVAFRQGNYAQAVKAYDAVIEQFPEGNKSAAAQLKKGYALLELGQRQAGIRELNALVTRYPRSLEAQQAKDRLRKLGAATPASKKSPRG